jgi:hypothetical protein
MQTDFLQHEYNLLPLKSGLYDDSNENNYLFLVLSEKDGELIVQSVEVVEGDDGDSISLGTGIGSTSGTLSSNQVSSIGGMTTGQKLSQGIGLANVASQIMTGSPLVSMNPMVMTVGVMAVDIATGEFSVETVAQSMVGMATSTIGSVIAGAVINALGITSPALALAVNFALTAGIANAITDFIMSRNLTATEQWESIAYGYEHEMGYSLNKLASMDPRQITNLEILAGVRPGTYRDLLSDELTAMDLDMEEIDEEFSELDFEYSKGAYDRLSDEEKASLDNEIENELDKLDKEKSSHDVGGGGTANGATGGGTANGGRDAGDSDGPSADGCFLAGTIVITTEGDKLIEEIEVGEVLIGLDGSENEVLELRRRTVGNRRIASINGSGFFITEDHPIYANGVWTSCSLLSTMMYEPKLYSELDMKASDLGNIEYTMVDPNTTVYNFKLDGNNTYTANGFIVHNK